MEKVSQSASAHTPVQLVDLGAASVETKGTDGNFADGGSQGQKFDPMGLIED